MRRHLEADEQVTAVGRCADITELGGPEQGGTSDSFVMITDRRLRWVPYSILAWEASLKLDDVSAFTERTLAHRYALRLAHPPLERQRWRPHETFPADLRERLRAEGRLRGDGVSSLSWTELAFSRPDTKAAKALREALAFRLGAEGVTEP
jgi:hypothetical protein